MYRQKTHKLRRITAGDYSAFTPSATGGGGSAADDGALALGISNSNYYSILVNSFITGRSNKLLLAVRTLLMQSSIHFPDVQFNGIEYEEQIVNREWNRIRSSEPPLGCDSVLQNRLALLDYLICGIGFTQFYIENGYPKMANLDMLDCCWDPLVRLPSQMTWVAFRVRKPKYYWEQLLGKKAADRGMSPDYPIEMIYYYDIEGAEGTWHMFRSHGENGIDDKAVFSGNNPYFYYVQDDKVPFLPVESMFHLELPSVRLPIGVVEQMIPNQLALHNTEAHINAVVERGKPFYEHERGAHDENAMKRFLKGDVAAIIDRVPGKGPMEVRPPLEVSQSTLAWQNYQDTQFMSQSGADPYVFSSVQPGTKFAAQVNAQQGAAGLMSTNTTRDYVKFLERGVRKFLAVGKRLDNKPITIQIGKAHLEFNEDDPVGQYLRPDAEIFIRDNTTAYMPREQQISEALADVQLAIQLAPIYPNAVGEAFKEYLLARGVKDVDARMAQLGGMAMSAGATNGQTPPNGATAGASQGGM